MRIPRLGAHLQMFTREKNMKKVLFATTALVASVGVAAAQNIEITGSAEMGIANSSGGGPSSNESTAFHSSIDVRFAMTGTADNGLDFGATIDLDDAVDEAVNGQDIVDDAGSFADYTVFISGNFGTLTLGDTDGGADFANVEVNLGDPGTLADDETTHAGYFGGNVNDGLGDFDGQILRYDYSVSGFIFAISAETAADVDDEYLVSLGIRYTFDITGGELGGSLAYSTTDDADFATAGDQGADIATLGLFVELDNGFSAAINYTEIDDDGFFGDDGEHIGIGASYSFDAWSFHANYGEFDWDAGATVEDAEGYGLAVAYDFGGGLSAHFGYGDSDFGDQNAAAAASDDDDTFSLGLAMSF